MKPCINVDFQDNMQDVEIYMHRSACSLHAESRGDATAAPANADAAAATPAATWDAIPTATSTGTTSGTVLLATCPIAD